MDLIWIILITILSTGLCTAGGIFLGIFLSSRKKDKLQIELMHEREKKLQDSKRRNLSSLYFELKDNIFILKDIKDLIKNKNFDLVPVLLEKIRVDQVFNLNRSIRLNKDEFEIIDELYSIKLFKNKIEFYIGLYNEKKVSLLEVRADVEKFIDKLEAIEKKFKDILTEI